jgi:hypothetical protein
VLTMPRVVQCVRTCGCLAVVSLMAAAPVFAQTPATVAPAGDQEQVRQEIDKLRAEFAAIQERLAALEAKLGTQPPVSAPPVQAPPVPVPATEPLAQPGNATALSKIFNPDMSVIGNFLGAMGTNEVRPIPAFEMNEAETTFQAVVDPYARADFFLAFGPEGVDLEEGFLTLTSLPGGLLAKVGKMKEQFGKVNTLHPHSLSWADKPLVMTNLLGGDEGMADSGVSVSKLLMNPWFFLEATGELYQGNSGPFASHERSDVSYVGRLRGYRDLTEGTNLDIGTSFAYGHNDASVDDTTRLFGIDATFRYRPLQRAIYKRFMGRGELIWSRRGQPSVNLGPQSSFGTYVSGDYQFARRWFAGARLDYSERAYDTTMSDKGASAVLTFWPSEFSQVRGQYRRTKYAEGTTANELLFQFLFSIGAHGAHIF